jgi:hypothetical protein
MPGLPADGRAGSRSTIDSLDVATETINYHQCLTQHIKAGMKTELNERNDKQHQATRHSPLLCWLPLFLVMVWTGCKQEAKVAADINPIGTYTLESVDGKKVPCSLTHEGRTLTVGSGVFTINADGTCSSKTSFSVPGGSDAGREVKATYTRQGPTLTMKWEGAGMTTCIVEGETFTMNNEGAVFTYRK